VLMNRQTVREVVPLMGKMDQGFWWEFSAICHIQAIQPIEIPIRHRLRSAGTTQIYHVRKMPGIFVRHFRALIDLRFGRSS